MRYVKITATTPYCGTDDVSIHVYPDDTPDSVIEADALQIAQDNAASYEYLVFGWDYDPEEDEDMTMEEYEETIDCYYADCMGNWEELTEEQVRECCEEYSLECPL